MIFRRESRNRVFIAVSKYLQHRIESENIKLLRYLGLCGFEMDRSHKLRMSMSCVLLELLSNVVGIRNVCLCRHMEL